MYKHKWHNKLFNLAVAFALVVSMVSAVVPVTSKVEAASPLSVAVTTENTTYCCSDTFNVTAMITVPEGAGPATNVSATISWNPISGLEELSPSATQTILSIGAGNSTPVIWQVHCNEPNPVIITVKVTADSPYAGPVSAQWWIEQTSAHLYTNIIWPEKSENGTAVMVCSTFNVTFDIINDGCRGANNIRVTVDPGLYTEVVIGDVGQGAGNIYTEPSFSLDADSSERFVLDLHCVEVGTDVIHVDIPFAKDNCTDLEIHGTSDLVGIIQYEQLIISCNATPQLTKTGYDVTFTADATGGIPFDPAPSYHWSWDFGDGTVDGTDKDDVHVYTTAGTYYPEVIVTDSWGNSANCTPGAIEVRRHPTITSCNATPNPTKIGYNTTFTATAIDGIGPYTWAWDFETDGTKDVTGLADPTYVWTYPLAGMYNATVYMSDAWVNNATCNVTVEVREHPLIEVCGANYTPTKVGVDTTFTATVIGGVGPYTWGWDFDNGVTMPDVTADPPPSTSIVHYTYSVPGTYTVTVNVTDALDNPASCNFTLEVKDHPEIIACNSTPTETKVGDEVYFDAWVIGGVPDYIWSWDVGEVSGEDFADTTTGTTSHVGPYTYSTPGTYTVDVSLLDKFKNPASCNFTIVIHPALNVTCDVTPDPQNVCHAVNFTAEREGGVPGNSYNWTWAFSDNTTAVGQNVSKTFMCVGNYTGTITLTDLDLGNTANCTANVTVTMKVPDLYNPELNETVLSRWVTFGWEDVLCCNYTLQVWQKDGAKEKVLLVETGKDNFWSGWIMDGDKYKWQVTATDSCGEHSITSEYGFFEVQDTNLKVAVTRPAEGASWAGGSTQTIMWTTDRLDSFASGFGAVGDEVITVDLSYSSDGTIWTPIATGQPEDGSYWWSVPDIDEDKCQIKAVASDGYGKTAVGYSGVFSITTADTVDPTITVNSPNGGESYAGGDSKTITWNATDNLLLTVTSVDLYFSFDGGVSWPVVALGEANDGSYSWTVPGVNSDMCLVKAVAFDAAGNSAADMSDSVFTITTATPDVNAPVVTVSRPVGGETFAGGSQEFILWSATDDVTAQGDIGILIYYKVGTGNWTSIAAFDGVNDGEYKWDVPEINSEQVLVKVVATDKALNIGFDVSNEFAIATEEVVVPVTSYNITLAEGWNLVSLPLIPTSNNITDVLAGVSGANVTQVWAFDPTLLPGDPWLSYYPWIAWSANELQEMNDGVGYWVVMDGAGTLTVNGQCMPDAGGVPPMYDVYAGWNLIGYKSITTRANDDYLANVDGKYTVIWGYNANTDSYDLVFPSPPGSGVLTPGSGYWVWMTEDGMIVPTGY